MDEWQTENLDACLETLIDYRGRSPLKSLTGIPVLSAKVVKTTGLIQPIEQMIATDYYSTWMVRGLPLPGDVVMTTEAPLGEVIQLDDQTARYALGQRVVCMRGRAQKLDNTFLRYLLSSPAQQAILAQYATGSTVLGISQKALRSVPISFPGFEEQKRIGVLLKSLDDKIALNLRINETLEATAQAIFRDWFVDFGPTHAKMNGRSPYLTSDIWSLFPDKLDESGRPVGWNERRVEDILELAYGKALKSDERTFGSIPVYGSGGVTGYHNEALVKEPSVVVGRKGSVGTLYWEDRPFFPIDTVFYVKPKAPLVFCYYQLKTLGLKTMNTDAAVPGLNRSNVYRLPVLWSSDGLPELFSELVTPFRQ
jgi:type I restriction enzyme S subunit